MNDNVMRGLPIKEWREHNRMFTLSDLNKQMSCTDREEIRRIIDGHERALLAAEEWKPRKPTMSERVVDRIKGVRRWLAIKIDPSIESDLDQS